MMFISFLLGSRYRPKTLLMVLFLIITAFVSAQNSADQYPHAVILGRSGEVITLSKNELSNWKSIQVGGPIAAEDIQIKEFDMSGKTNGSLFESHAEGNRLNKEMLEFVQSGNRIEDLHVDQITVIYRDQTIRQLSPVTIKIRYN